MCMHFFRTPFLRSIVLSDVRYCFIFQINRKRWAVALDIFAPDIIIPQNRDNADSPIVVLNLGHITFANHEGNFTANVKFMIFLIRLNF